MYCQNYEISQLGKGREITIEELAEIFLKQQEKNVNNINLVTPTMYAYQIIEAIKIARKNGLKLPIIYNTNGYENVETIRALEGYIDVYLPDLKYYSDILSKKYSGVDSYFKVATEAIKEFENKHIQTATGLLTMLYRQILDNPTELQSINNYYIVGRAFLFMLHNQLSDDVDTIQTISSIAYLCISKAIKQNVSDLNLYKDRLLVLILGYGAFKYTVMSVLRENKEKRWSITFFDSSAVLFSENAIWQMQFFDMETIPVIYSSSFFEEQRKVFIKKLQRQFFLPAKTIEEVLEQGRSLHEKVYDYLSNKIFIEADIDF